VNLILVLIGLPMKMNSFPSMQETVAGLCSLNQLIHIPRRCRCGSKAAQRTSFLHEQNVMLVQVRICFLEIK